MKQNIITTSEVTPTLLPTWTLTITICFSQWLILFYLPAWIGFWNSADTKKWGLSLTTKLDQDHSYTPWQSKIIILIWFKWKVLTRHILKCSCDILTLTLKVWHNFELHSKCSFCIFSRAFLIPNWSGSFQLKLCFCGPNIQLFISNKNYYLGWIENKWKRHALYLRSHDMKLW